MSPRKRHTRLAVKESALGQPAKRTESNRIFDLIPDDRALDSAPCLGDKFVAVPPALERSLWLDVREVMIPFKLRDPSDPARSEGKWWQHSKRRHDFCSHSGYRSCDQPAPPDRGHQVESFDSGRKLWWHQAREVLGISEEQKHSLQRERHPIFESRQVTHRGILLERPVVAGLEARCANAVENQIGLRDVGNPLVLARFDRNHIARTDLGGR